MPSQSGPLPSNSAFSSRPASPSKAAGPKLTNAFGDGAENFEIRGLAPEDKTKWETAKRAVSQHLKQWDYAKQLLTPLIEQHPEFLDARRLKREVEINAHWTPGWREKFPSPASFISDAKAELTKGNPLEAIQILERKVFVYLPGDTNAAKVLHDAALELNLPKTALFALETAVRCNPEEIEPRVLLADHYEQTADFNSAVSVYAQILIIDPTRHDIVVKHKDAMARGSLLAGMGVKDDDLRRDLEQREKRGLDPEQKRLEIYKLVDAYNADKDNPDSIAGLKRAGGFAEELRDWETAASIYTALLSFNPADGTLRAKVENINLKLSEQNLETLRAGVELLSGEAKTERESQIAEAQAAFNQARLNIAESRVAANPTEKTARLELGAILIDLARPKEALQHLQQAVNDPKCEIDARILLARAFETGGLKDFAVKELEKALQAVEQRKLPNQAEKSNEVRYSLGLLYERMGQTDKAAAAFMEIFAVDSTYRDVAERVPWGA